MTLSEAIEKANEYQHEVGTTLNRRLIEAILPVPKESKEFTKFINLFKNRMLYFKREDIDFNEINEHVNALDFGIVRLYEGTLHTNKIIQSGNIFWEEIKD